MSFKYVCTGWSAHCQKVTALDLSNVSIIVPDVVLLELSTNDLGSGGCRFIDHRPCPAFTYNVLGAILLYGAKLHHTRQSNATYTITQS